MMREGINPTTGAALETANRILFGLGDMSQAKPQSTDKISVAAG